MTPVFKRHPHGVLGHQLPRKMRSHNFPPSQHLQNHEAATLHLRLLRSRSLPEQASTSLALQRAHVAASWL